MKAALRHLLALALLATPLAALAQDGYVTANVSLRAGPDIAYPLIAVIPEGAPIAVQGCTSGWEWCDVIADGNRGWVDGYFIQYDYDDRPVLLPDYGARIGIPIISFSIVAYWDHHYRGRPFYRERRHWYHRPMPHRPPPRPPHRPRPIRRPHAPHRPALVQPRPPMRPPADHRPSTRPPADHRPSTWRPDSRRPQSRPASPTHTTPRPPQGHNGHWPAPPPAQHGKPSQDRQGHKAPPPKQGSDKRKATKQDDDKHHHH